MSCCYSNDDMLATCFFATFLQALKRLKASFLVRGGGLKQAVESEVQDSSWDIYVLYG